MENVKKESNKEMELNEQLTSSNIKIENDIKAISKILANGTEKFNNVESQIIKLTKINEQGQIGLDAACAVRFEQSSFFMNNYL